MGRLEQIGKKRFAPGKGVEGRTPQKGVKRFFYLYLTHFWRLITLNLLFVLFCIPVVTIPAAFCGMNRVLINLVREGNCFLWSDFKKEFKANLLKSLPFGILHVFLLLDGAFFFNLYTVAEDPGRAILAAGAGFVFISFAVIFSSYVFVLLPTLELKNKHIARNAFILMIMEWKTSLLILGSTGVLAIGTFAFLPFSAVFMLLQLFSVLQLIVCTAINEPLQRRIIDPFEQKNKDA